MIADAVMLNCAALLGLLISYGAQKTSGYRPEPFGTFVLMNLASIVLLNIISLPTFYLFGFYTRSRAYQGRYKALVVCQAVGVSYLAFTACCFLFQSAFPFPRVGLLIGAGLTALFLAGARIWMAAWRGFSQVEPSFRGTHFDIVHKPKNVVVIGGAGYIGSGLLAKLLDRGYRVRLVDSFMFGEEPIAHLLGHRNLEVVRADFRQIDKIVEAMYGMDAVIHIGAIVGDPACALDEDFTIEVNLMATRMIAECAKGFGIQKFIFASTCSVYGASDEVLNEKSALNPVSLYARSKIACEKILLQMADDRFRPTILRFGTVYGLSGRTRFDLVVNLLTAKAIVDGKITVFGDDQWRPFVHVDDASLAIALALDSTLDVVGGEVFNVGSDSGNMTLGDVGRMIQRMVPTAELLISNSDGDRRNYRVDFSKIRNRLGYKPEWTVQMGIRQVIEAFEKGKVTDYTATQYSNVKFLSEEALHHGLQTDSRRMRALVEESYEQAVVHHR
ncbi:MAG: NAD-dependent epimerase/dehydratase family protein [Armatimonadetes bacterium]|nr:NAD-dependent epimerase/dehydratase family protein [Armatimonadota bacterium]MBS1726628.1 NAD-dependent epimerase/dehydratase family protein [Armatimonadota bacterium]